MKGELRALKIDFQETLTHISNINETVKKRISHMGLRDLAYSQLKNMEKINITSEFQNILPEYLSKQDAMPFCITYHCVRSIVMKFYRAYYTFFS